MRLAAALFSMALIVAGPALAESERAYDVEIVIVENTDTRAGERERWRPEVVVPRVEGAIVPPSAAGTAAMARRERMAETPEGFTALPPERRQLGGAIEALEESGGYRVLRHLAWRQPATDQDAALPVRARHGEAITVRIPIRDFDELYALEDAAERGAAASGGAGSFGAGPMDRRDGGALLRPVQIHPLDGTVKVVVSRYLHVYTDLYFTTAVEWTALPAATAGSEAVAGEEAGAAPSAVRAPSVALGPDGQAMLSYPFVQHRRMRSGELHYLDHPVLGLLIRVDRAPEEEEGESPEADAEEA